MCTVDSVDSDVLQTPVVTGFLPEYTLLIFGLTVLEKNAESSKI